MAGKDRIYIAIDLKSFYASVECVERGLNPLTTNLVVADRDRSRKTICLAVSPSLKQHGVPGRPRLFQVIQKVKEANSARKRQARLAVFTDKSWDDTVLQAKPDYAIDYVVATPRMALYLDYSTRIYGIYLKYIAPEDIHVYSIDEVFMDVTSYLETYQKTAWDLAMTIIRDVLKTTGITATAGLGTNLYLAKAAMDIVAKRSKPDKDGVRIAELDEMSYRNQLWDHRPLTDFWRVGKGYATKLEAEGLFTMGDIARCSLGKPSERYNEDLLYKLFGINAELLIDHAWGWEPCTIADIKAYKPSSRSIGSGQVLPRAYTYEEAKLVVREMADLLALDLVSKGLITDQVVLTVTYDKKGQKHAHGTANLEVQTSSAKLIIQAMTELYTRITDENLPVRKINISAGNVVAETNIEAVGYEQLDLFTDPKAAAKQQEAQQQALHKEKQAQTALLKIQEKYGKNSILKGMNLLEGATARDKNTRIGGHKA